MTTDFDSVQEVEASCVMACHEPGRSGCLSPELVSLGRHNLHLVVLQTDLPAWHYNLHYNPQITPAGPVVTGREAGQSDMLYHVRFVWS
jgi:hypothetical protein